MHILHANHITVNYAGHDIFRDLSWSIGDRDRVGLVGPNGAGKSSLLKTLAGLYQPDAGKVVRTGNVSVGYLPQDVQLTSGHTLLDEALTLPLELARIEGQLADIEAFLSTLDLYTD
jgi:ATP-binding cassette subfamily F protein 3